MPTLSAFDMAAPGDACAARRARLAAGLPRPLVIFSGHPQPRNYPDNDFPFRPASSFTYFGGPPLPHAAWFVEPGSDGRSGCTLFRPTAGVEESVWVGEAPTDADIAAAAGLPVSALADPDQLERRVAGRDAAGIAGPFMNSVAWMQRCKLKPATDDELRQIVNLRLCKDVHELEAMRLAARISVEAQRAALAAVRVGRRESDVAAAFMAVLVAQRSTVSYNPIISIRGEVLHAGAFSNTLADGSLLLIDAAAEGPTGYGSDITRTVPVNGRWTTMQREVYEVVLRAQQAVIAAAVPGARWRDLHYLAARHICEGLAALGFLRGRADDLLARNAHAPFFPHGVGHLIGLDVHDCRDFGDVAGYPPGRTRPTEFGAKWLRMDRDLAPGLCATVEPGVYFIPAVWACGDIIGPLADVVNRKRVDEMLASRFGGIRIEHTIAVRAAGGPEVLTAALPTAADEIVGLLNR